MTQPKAKQFVWEILDTRNNGLITRTLVGPYVEGITKQALVLTGIPKEFLMVRNTGIEKACCSGCGGTK